MRSFPGLVASLVLGSAVASAFPAGAVGGASQRACGAVGKPACPLQDWMRKRVAAPFATHDAAGLAGALDELAHLNPDPRHWLNWEKYARDGAARVRAGKDPLLVCVNCHKVYRAEYNAKYRERPVAP